MFHIFKNYFLLLFIGIVLSGGFVFAEAGEESTKNIISGKVVSEVSTPQSWKSHIILLNLGEIKKEDGRFWVSFILGISGGDSVDFRKEKPQFGFINSQKVELTEELIEKDYYEVVVRGVFFTKMDFRNFPFNSINLEIIIEPLTPRDAKRVIFEVAPENTEDNKIIDQLFYLPGWNFSKSSVVASIYKYSDEWEFSRINTNLSINKDIIGSFLKHVLPITLILIVSFFSYLVRGNYSIKVYLTVVLFYPMVYLHSSAMSDLPSVGYLTIMDKIVLIYYALLMNNIIGIIRQANTHLFFNCHDKAHRYNVMHLQFVPFIILIGVLLLMWV